MNSNTNQKINQVTEAYIVHTRGWQARYTNKEIKLVFLKIY